jgi:hypothetical protein
MITLSLMYTFCTKQCFTFSTHLTLFTLLQFPDTSLTARSAAAELVEKLLKEIEIPLTSSTSYNVDNGAKWIGGVENHFMELYVPGGSRNNDVALQLLNDGTDLSNIKSTDMHSATSILKMYHDMAIADPANTTNTPEITTPADAQDEAERLNTRVQFVTGVKEALAKIVTATFGRRITDQVLHTADGSNFKSINDWTAEELMEAICQGADRPTADNTHAKALKIFNFQFNFQTKIQQNYDALNAKAGQLKTLASSSILHSVASSFSVKLKKHPPTSGDVIFAPPSKQSTRNINTIRFIRMPAFWRC